MSYYPWEDPTTLSGLDFLPTRFDVIKRTNAGDPQQIVDESTFLIGELHAFIRLVKETANGELQKKVDALDAARWDFVENHM